MFPEAFIGGYPRGSTFGVCIGNRSAKGKEEFRKYHAAAIDVPGKLCFLPLRQLTFCKKLAAGICSMEKRSSVLNHLLSLWENRLVTVNYTIIATPTVLHINFRCEKLVKISHDSSVDVIMVQLSFTILSPTRKYTCIGELNFEVWKLKTCVGWEFIFW